MSGLIFVPAKVRMDRLINKPLEFFSGRASSNQVGRCCVKGELIYVDCVIFVLSIIKRGMRHRLR